MKISIKRKYRFLLAIALLLAILVVVISNFIIEISAREKTYTNPELTPKNKVGLVLGTSRMLVEGGVNPYYKHRIDATIALY
ncbi:MAG: vancomycin high temperature exclusion protein, partial [Eudoraea sp.]|nr:vancomycin high temperature exclusion protein [Eudoraea sp.]